MHLFPFQISFHKSDTIPLFSLGNSTQNMLEIDYYALKQNCSKIIL